MAVPVQDGTVWSSTDGSAETVVMDYLQFALDNARTEFGETMIDPARPVPSDYRPLNMNYTRPVRLDDVCQILARKF